MKNNDNKLVKNNKSWLIAAIIISVIEVGFIIFYHFHSGFHRSVVGIYFDAARDWINGVPIYIIDFVGGFNYFLQSAILLEVYFILYVKCSKNLNYTCFFLCIKVLCFSFFIFLTLYSK